MWWELEQFCDDLEKLETLLYEIASREDEIEVFGLSIVLKKIGIDKVRSVFDDFSSNVDKCVRMAPLIDRSISERLNALLNETGIEDLISQLYVRLKIAEGKHPRLLVRDFPRLVSYINRLLKIRSASLFPDKTVQLEGVLASLARLRTLAKSLVAEHFRRTAGDDEIFTPSNININFVVIQIDTAIEKLTSSSDIGPSEKERLIKYLVEAKAELAEDSPAWKKVIGALIISATLLSGIAAAPQAIENLNTAIVHILGTSVEKNMPNLLPELPSPSEEKNDDTPPTVIT